MSKCDKKACNCKNCSSLADDKCDKKSNCEKKNCKE